MPESVFTSQTPTSGNNVEPGGINAGFIFTPSVNGVVTHIRLYSTITVGGVYTGQLYLPTADDDPEGSGAGTLLGSGTLAVPPSPSTWTLIELDDPVPVTAGQSYRAAYHNTEGRYVSTPAFAEFASGGLTNGSLTAPPSGTDIGVGTILQGVYRTGAIGYPSNYFNNSNYFADVVFEPDAAEGAAAFVLDLAVATEGEAPVVPPTTGDADTFALVLTLAAEGETPAVDSASGTAAFSLVLTVASEGAPETPASVRCGWEGIDPEALGVCDDWSGYSIEARNAALEMATEFMWANTGRQYGVCPVTVWPSQPGCATDQTYQAYPMIPGRDGGLTGAYLFGGRWFNPGTCSACCNTAGCAIVLRGPVASVTEVLVDGAAVEPSAYRVDAGRGVYLLVRQDGECWPSCAREPGDFTVTYSIGRAIPASLAVATALLACEYGKSLSGGACALPARMTSLSRQGVEVELAAPDPGKGLTGIREIDDVITALNPSRRQAPPVLMSPDLPEWGDRMTVWNA